MAKCRNPECHQGLNPGVIAVGGNSKLPLFGEGASRQAAIRYRWGWVRCLACNKDPEKDKAVSFKLVRRSPDEIQQRRELANNKAPYQPDQQPTSAGSVLGGLAHVKPGAASSPAASVSGAPLPNNDQFTRLLEANTKLAEQVNKLTSQISELLEENRALRKALDVYSAARAQNQSTAIVPAPT